MTSTDILVLNDQPEVRSYQQTLLQEAGFSVHSVATCAEALALIRKDKPQLILLDVDMAEMPGDEFCKMIKRDPTLQDIVVFILTSRGDLETKLACFAGGAEEYLVQPVDTRELIARVARFIRLIDRLKTPHPPSRGHEPLKTPIAQPAERQREPISPTPQSSLEVGSLALSDYSFLQFQTTYGVYRVESLVGRGGMGQVYKARDELLERYVAIKVLASKLSNAPEFVERFRREAKVLASINHPGIASIYSFSEQKGEHYFAMQWCSGGSVSDLIKARQVDPLNAVDIVLQCARALLAASKKGIVHRDIKPSNLMFDENQLIKLVDFGLAYAQQISANLTQGSEFLGTPSYMAPEQAKSPSVDHRADIYSLGITFYHMLYGKLPFEASSAVDMVIKHSLQPFPSYDDRNGQISNSIYGVVQKMTQKDPATRYQDYPSLIHDLEHVRNELFNQRQLKVPRMGQASLKPAVKSTNFFETLATLHNSGDSGLLKVRWAGLQKQYLVRNREIIFFESTQTGENIWSALVEKKLMKQEDVPASGADMESKLNRFLLNQVFSLADFKKTYRELMMSSITEVFYWPVFESEFVSAAIHHEPFSSIRIAEFLMDASRTVLDYQILKSAIPAGGQLSRTFQFDDVLRTLPLNPEESFVASRLEGGNMTIDTLEMLAGIPEDRIVRLLYALLKFGALQVKTPETKQSRKMEAARYQTQPASASSPGGQFQPSSIHAVPSNFNPPEPAARQSQQQSTPLSEAELREQYLAELHKKRFQMPPPEESAKVRMEVQKSEKKIELEQHVRDAEAFYQMAEKKFEDGFYYDVTHFCKQAVALNPAEAKYHLLMAHAYSKHPRFVKDAEVSYQKAVDLDPWNTEYRIQLAEFYMDQGLSSRALNECKKILQIMPQHVQAQELQKQLASKRR